MVLMVIGFTSVAEPVTSRTVKTEPGAFSVERRTVCGVAVIDKTEVLILTTMSVILFG